MAIKRKNKYTINSELHRTMCEEFNLSKNHVDYSKIKCSPKNSLQDRILLMDGAPLPVDYPGVEKGQALDVEERLLPPLESFPPKAGVAHHLVAAIYRTHILVVFVDRLSALYRVAVPVTFAGVHECGAMDGGQDLDLFSVLQLHRHQGPLVENNRVTFLLQFRSLQLCWHAFPVPGCACGASAGFIQIHEQCRGRIIIIHIQRMSLVNIRGHELHN